MKAISPPFLCPSGAVRSAVVAGELCILVLLAGCGENFTKEGNSLGLAINGQLVAQKLCVDASECQKKFEMYGGHGNQVNFSVYAVRDPKLVQAVTGFVASEGIRITKGVPISIAFYADDHKNHVNVFNFSKPIIQLEVLK